MTYTILMLYDISEHWLRLSHKEREQFNHEVLEPLIQRYTDSLTVRLFDSEAFSGSCSDFALFETSNLQEFYFFIEALRDTRFYTVPYIHVRDIIMGIEGGFRQYLPE